MSNQTNNTAPPSTNLSNPYSGAKTFTKGQLSYGPGLTMRSQRVREFVVLKAIELRRADPDLTEAEAEELASAELDRLAERPNAKEIFRQFDDFAPTSTAPDRAKIDDDVELAASLWHAPVRWLKGILGAQTNRRGFAANREMVIAAFFQMALGKCRPDAKATHQRLRRGHTLLSWAHDYPEPGPGKSAFYKSLRGSLEAAPPRAALHVNFELFRQLTGQADGRGKPLNPDAGKVLIVDGSLVEANVQQRSPKNGAHRAVLVRPGQEKVAPVIYTLPNGQIRTFVHGYKLMTIACMATTLPLVWRLVPASADERQETLLMLRDLFELWPDCPAHTIVGDALYNRSKDFLRSLIFQWGLHPCFPGHGPYAEGTPHAATDGIPHCACREPMKFKDTDRYYTLERRQKEGIARGEWAPSRDARLRWVCRNDRCKLVSTRPYDDPRLYTWYHRGGDHRRGAQRTALLVRRNAIESVFASLKHFGCGGSKVERARWANSDETMDWLLGTALMGITARRWSHESGVYQQAHQEASQLGLLDQPVTSNPVPGPSAATLAKVRRARFARLGPPIEPATWGLSTAP
jgi:hypothetical protein